MRQCYIMLGMFCGYSIFFKILSVLSRGYPQMGNTYGAHRRQWSLPSEITLFLNTSYVIRESQCGIYGYNPLLRPPAVVICFFVRSKINLQMLLLALDIGMHSCGPIYGCARAAMPTFQFISLFLKMFRQNCIHIFIQHQNSVISEYVMIQNTIYYIFLS